MGMDLDEAMNRLGSFGLWQMGHYVLLGVCFGMASSWQLFAIVFIGYYNYHVCQPAGNATIDEGIPIVDTGYGYDDYSMCTRYKQPGISNVTEGCDDGYIFALENFAKDTGTMVMEWGLICDKEAYVETSQTVFNLGVVVGFFACTPFGDIYGRKRVFFICQLFMNVFGVAMAFSPNFEMFCVMQFLTGAFAAGLLMAGTVLALEMFPSDLRVFLAPFTGVFPALGMVTLPAWAYVLNSWRDLQFGISVAGFFTLIYIFWCPESIRWLMTTGNYRQANRLLARAAQLNSVELPENPLGTGNAEQKSADTDDEIDQNNTGRMTIGDYVRAPRPRRYFIIMMYLLFTDNIMYYGLSLMTGALEAFNVYLNFFINAIVEFPAIIMSIVCMAYLGRRPPVIAFHFLAALFMALCGIISAINLDEYWSGQRDVILAVFAFLGKFSISAAWCVIFVYAQEIFPTNIRNTGLGFIAGAGYIGSIIAPYSVYLFRIIPWVPTTIFACLSIVAGILTFFVPETMGRNLPMSIEDVSGWPIALTPEEKETVKNFKLFGKRPVQPIKIDRKSRKANASFHQSEAVTDPPPYTVQHKMGETSAKRDENTSDQGTDNQGYTGVTML